MAKTLTSSCLVLQTVSELSVLQRFQCILFRDVMDQFRYQLKQQAVLHEFQIAERQTNSGTECKQTILEFILLFKIEF